MKKLAKRLVSVTLSLAMITTLLPTTFATSVSIDNSTSSTDISSSDELLPPPELIILEGEEWLPDAIDPLSISTFGVDDDCRHNGASPKNYRYIGAVRGSTKADVTAVDTFTFVVSALIGGPAGMLLSFVGLMRNIFPGQELEGNYIKYQYIYNFGLDPNMYWFHTWYSFATKNGEPVGSTCTATYSPKKQSDGFFQD